MLELFYTFVANLAKVMNERKTELPESIQHYVEKDDYNRFSPKKSGCHRKNCFSHA